MLNSLIPGRRSSINQHNNRQKKSLKYNRETKILNRFSTLRQYSTLTHVDASSGKASMVDVGDKNISERVAKARGRVFVGETICGLIRENSLKKGDVITVAQLAGIMAAKQTSNLIPLCHPLSINYVDVKLTLNDSMNSVDIESEVRCKGKTGVEMEALTAVSVAALTIYDMCKSVNPPHAMIISDICLVSKTGGTKGDFQRIETEIKSTD